MKQDKLYILGATGLALMTGLGLYVYAADETTTSTTSAEQQQKQDTTSTQENSEYFSDTDLTDTYDEASASQIKLADSSATVSGTGVTYADGTVNITAAGTYIISGASKQIQIKITAPDEAKVQLVLKDVTMTHDSAPVIYVESADKVVVTSAADTKNQLSDGANASDESLDAAVFSNDDITFNGSGSLAIAGNYANAVESNDDLRIVGTGQYQFTAVKNGLSANDAVNIEAATVTIEAGKDGIHVSNDEDTSLGNVYLNPTNLTITAEDDGVDASNKLLIAGGQITVTQSTEGLEAKVIQQLAGDVKVTSSDDGLNASEGSSESSSESNAGNFNPMAENNPDLQIVIDGGTLTVNAEGDGLDSNGALIINGGTVFIDGPTNAGNGALDAGATTINGGNIIALDMGGMSQGFGSDSSQASVMTAVSGQAGSKITLTDSEGKELLAYTAEKTFQNIVISTEGMRADTSYQLTVDDQTVEVTASLTTQGNQMMGGPQMPGGQTPNGQMPGGQMPGGQTPPAKR